MRHGYLNSLDHLARVKQQVTTLPKDVLLLRGEVKKVEILAEKGRLGRMRVVEESDRLLLLVPEERAQDGRALLAPWLRGLSRAEIEKTARQRATQMKLNYRAITIRDQKTRWGSCSNRGTLSFNWRLIMAPPQVLDYVGFTNWRICSNQTTPKNSGGWWNTIIRAQRKQEPGCAAMLICCVRMT
jgi:predicted metal-dependent hydrolase